MHQIRAASNASNDQIRSPAIHCQHIWPSKYCCTWDWAADDPELRKNFDIDNIPLHLYLKRFLLQVHCQRLELGLIWAQHYKGEHSSIGTILDSYSSSEAHWRQCERSQEEGGWRVQGWVGLKTKVQDVRISLSIRRARVLLSTSAGSMGLDVPTTNLVVINSSPSTTWEFSQEVGLCIFIKNLLGKSNLLYTLQQGSIFFDIPIKAYTKN